MPIEKGGNLPVEAPKDYTSAQIAEQLKVLKSALDKPANANTLKKEEIVSMEKFAEIKLQDPALSAEERTSFAEFQNISKQYLETLEETQKRIAEAKSEQSPEILDIDTFKKALESIEKIDVKDQFARGLATNYLIGRLESEGLDVMLGKDKKIIITTTETAKKNLAVEFGRTWNLYEKSEQWNHDNIRTALLYRTSAIDSFSKSSTDTAGKTLGDVDIEKRKYLIMKEKSKNPDFSTDSYVQFLLTKYGAKESFNPAQILNFLKDRKDIEPKDRTFLTSFANDAYSGFAFDIFMKQYADVQKKVEKIADPENIRKVKGLIEKFTKEPLTEENMNVILDVLPKDDSVVQSLIVRGLIGKLRTDGYIITTTQTGISIESREPAKTTTAEAFQKIFNTKTGKADIEEALIISSGSLVEFKTNYKGDISKATNKEYVQFVMNKYKLAPTVSVKEIQDNKTISQEEKSLLVSSISGGITENIPLSQTIKDYDTMKKSMEELLGSPDFKKMETLVAQSMGEKVPAANIQDLAGKVTEDPSILSGKPLTVIAAGFALFFGLGYEGKGKGFNLWTGLKRGFIGLLVLFLGKGVANEWGMDPKELIKSGMDAMKGNNESDETPEAPAAAGRNAPANAPEKVGLTDTQKLLRDSIMKDQNIVEKVTKCSETAKKYGVKGTGTIDEYLGYIEKDIPLAKLFPNDHKKSIFFDGGDMEISLENKFDPRMFKTILRAYLMGTGYETLTGNADAQGVSEKESFLKNYDITANDIKTKKLSDVLGQIQKKCQTASAPAPASAPASAPKLSLVVGGTTVEIGKHVQIKCPSNTAVIFPLDDAGKPLGSLNNGNQVKLLGESKQFNSKDYVQVEHSGQKMYVQIEYLKANPTK